MATDKILTIYDELRKRALGIDDRNGSAPQGLLFSLMPGGLPINPDDFTGAWTLGAGAGQTAAQIQQSQARLARLSNFLDFKLAMNGSGLALTGTGKISDTWQVIINSAEPRNPPAPNPATLQRVQAAANLLFDPATHRQTPLYAAYDSFADAYFQANIAYTAAYQTAMSTPAGAAGWPLNGMAHIHTVDQAREHWQVMGGRRKVEDALATINSQGSNAIERVIDLARKSFDAYQIAAPSLPVAIPYVEVLPSDWASPTAIRGWHQYGYSEDTTHTAHSQETTSWGASGGVSWGFWSVGGSAGGSSTTIHDEFSSSGLKLELTYAPVTISRPWLNTLLLSLGGWGLVGADKGVISNGTGAQFTRPGDGAYWLPSIPTHMLLVKNVRLWTADIQRAADFAQSQRSSGGSFGWGPFTIGGSSSRFSQNSSANCHMENGWLVIEGTQLAGWISQIMPNSPLVSGL